MPLVTQRIEDAVLYLELNGRIDSTNAEQASNIIKEIRESHPDLRIVIDAEKLEYVASSGLRTILKLAKTEKNFSVVNVSPIVYSVFEMTGFARIITIKKALRKIDLEKCEKIGAGGNGAVYRISEDEIVKVNYNPATDAELDV